MNSFPPLPVFAWTMSGTKKRLTLQSDRILLGGNTTSSGGCSLPLIKYTIWAVSVVSLLFTLQSQAAEPDATPATSDAAGSMGMAKVVSEVRIAGNDRVEEEAIRVYLTSRPKEPLNPDTVDSDVRAIYKMGFFKDVEARLTEENGKTILTYW